MKIVLFDPGTMIGRAIAKEALTRGHEVTAVVRDPADFDLSDDRLTVAVGDVTDIAIISEVVAGHDAVISAVGPHLPEGNPQILAEAARSLIDGLTQVGVHRLVVVSTENIEVAPGVQLVETEFPSGMEGRI